MGARVVDGIISTVYIDSTEYGKADMEENKRRDRRREQDERMTSRKGKRRQGKKKPSKDAQVEKAWWNTKRIRAAERRSKGKKCTAQL